MIPTTGYNRSNPDIKKDVGKSKCENKRKTYIRSNIQRHAHNRYQIIALVALH